MWQVVRIRKDYQCTLPLTCRLLSTFPSRAIHVFFSDVFDEDICQMGERKRGEDFWQSVQFNCECFPSLVDYSTSIVGDIHKQDPSLLLSEREIAIVVYLAVIGVDRLLTQVREKMSLDTCSTNLYLSLKKQFVLIGEDQMKNILFSLLLCLMRFELEDHAIQTLQVLDITFKVSEQMAKCILLFLAHRDDPGYRSEYLSLLSKRIKIWHPPRYLEARVRYIREDLATYYRFLKECDVTDDKERVRIGIHSVFGGKILPLFPGVVGDGGGGWEDISPEEAVIITLSQRR